MSEVYGYNGKILRIDLTRRSYREEELSEEFYRLYAGGGLLGTYFLLRETKSHIDPLGADNLLVFTSSVIAGLKGVGLARFSVISKSPLSGGIGETRCEGPWGAALKASGFDALLVTGRAEQPLYIIIKGGRVEFYDAAALWGKDTAVTTRSIRQHHGEQAHVATIGPAGEKLVRYASVVTDFYYQAMRMGMGAVMGSKNLKAIVLVEGSLPALADPVAFARITALNQSRINDNELTRWQKEPPGFSAWVDTITDPGYLSFENFRSGKTPDIRPFAKDRSYKIRRSYCPPE